MRVFSFLTVLILFSHSTYAGWWDICHDIAARLSKPKYSEEMLPEFERETPAFRELHITAKDLEEAKAAIEMENSPNKKAKKAFDFYLNGRLKRSPRWFQEKVREVLAQAHVDVHRRHNSTLAYTEGVRRLFFSKPIKIYVGVNDSLYDTSVYYALLAHEVEHAIQKLDGKYNVKNNPDEETYLHEFGAVRAEYEYWKFVPETVIENDLTIAQNIKADPKPIFAADVPDEFEERTRLVKMLQAAKKPFGLYREANRYSSRDEVELAY